MITVALLIYVGLIVFGCVQGYRNPRPCSTFFRRKR